MKMLAGAPTWAMVLAITVIVMGVPVLALFAVSWLWPGADPGLVMVCNLFFGMILGSAGVVGFLLWRWEVRR